MARRAIRDTYAIARIGGTELRRRVVAGQLVPGGWAIDPADVEELSTPSPADTVMGARVQPPRRQVKSSVKEMTVDEMRGEVQRRIDAGEQIEVEGGVSKARRADLLKALGVS